MSIRTLLVLALSLAAPLSVSVGQETAGIGILLGTEGGDLVVKEILPDSAAATSKAIKVGDRIVGVAQDTDPPVQVKGKGVVATARLIRGAKGTTARLTIVPAGKDEAQAIVVSLVRGELKMLDAWGDGVLLTVGSKAPNVRLLSLKGGKPEQLADFAGKVVVLEFWSTWCVPCQKVMADLQSYPAKHPDWKDKVVFIAASVEEQGEAVLKHVQARGWEKTHNVRVGPEAVKAFHVGALPTTYVIDQQGKVVAADNRLDIPKLVETLLRQGKGDATTEGGKKHPN
jgi:thiol-disulfide isomerase/thioredoxin